MTLEEVSKEYKKATKRKDRILAFKKLSKLDKEELVKFFSKDEINIIYTYGNSDEMSLKRATVDMELSYDQIQRRFFNIIYALHHFGSEAFEFENIIYNTCENISMHSKTTIRNLLFQQGISTLDALKRIYWEDLLNIVGFGNAYIRDLYHILKEHNITLKGTIPEKYLEK